MTNLQTVLKKVIDNRRFLPISYLALTYNAKELDALYNECNNLIKRINSAIMDKTESDLGLTKFNAYASNALLGSQLIFIRRAKKHLNGIHEAQFGTMEGAIIDFDLKSN